MTLRVLLLLGLLWATVPVESNAAPAKKERYISQELIDTSIQRGFILLNASADMAGVGFNHQKSIIEAKKIVQTLRQKAHGDPNEKYVLWKVGELEAQIYLEESDLLFQEMQKRQLTINELVAKYNKEVGKWRPDFATLYRIHKTMDQVDGGKANELADSYNQRKRAISREAVYFLEKALLAGNGDSARKELGYCLRNQLYLDISQSAYKRLEDRVEGLLRAQEKRPVIDAEIKAANRLLDTKNIAGARRVLDTANGLLSEVKEFLPQRDLFTVTSSYKRATGRLGAIEDSLVDVNASILRSKGVEAADKYLQTVVRVLGVSHEKAAQIDRMIISVRSPDDGKPTAVAGLDAEADDASEGSPVLDDIMMAARKKAQDKQDSLLAIENARLWRERQEQNRLDSIAAVARAAQEAAQRARQLRADSVVMVIYAFIEKNDIKSAKALLGRENTFLAQYMRPDEHEALKTTINYFAEAPVEKKSVVTYLKPVEGAAAAPQPDVAPAVKTNLDRAQEEIVGIYAMLEKNDVGRAYKRFQTNKAPLRKYLAPEAFSMLEMSVTQAYEYYAGKR